MKGFQFWYKLVIILIALFLFSIATANPVEIFFSAMIVLLLFLGLGKLALSFALPSKHYFLLKFYAFNMVEISFIFAFLSSTVWQEKMIPFWMVLLLFSGYVFIKTYWDIFPFKRGLAYCKVHFAMKPEIYDRALITDYENQKFNTQLFLVKNTLVFYTKSLSKNLTTMDITAVEPELMRHKIFRFPTGLYFPHHKVKVFINFPRFWLKIIEQNEQEQMIA